MNEQDSISANELEKIRIRHDAAKHMATVSSGAIVILATFGDGVTLLRGIATMLLAINIVATLLFIGYQQEKLGEIPTREYARAANGWFVSCITFMLGIFALAVSTLGV